MKTFLRPAAIMLGSVLCATPVSAVNNNLKFGGTLVSDPCELDPATSDLTVDFGSVIVKGLYLHQRTSPKPLTIKLINCDTALGNEVTLTFSGTESATLPGALAVSGTATGIAIMLQYPDGTPLAINQPSPAWTLVNSTNSFTLQAYVSGEPDALQALTITAGDFSATATFEMAYP